MTNRKSLMTALRLRSLFLILAASFLFAGCGKNQFVWMNYDETSCADKWSFDLNNERLKDNVTAYLDSKGIKVLEIEIFVDGTAETCLACTCKTGRRIKCKVKKKEEDNLQGEGFYK